MISVVREEGGCDNVSSMRYNDGRAYRHVQES